MSYSEMRNNFLNAASLDAEIKKFRIERLSELLEDNTKMFGVIHIIPAFLQIRQSLFQCVIWEKQKASFTKSVAFLY